MLDGRGTGAAARRRGDGGRLPGRSRMSRWRARRARGGRCRRCSSIASDGSRPSSPSNISCAAGTRDEQGLPAERREAVGAAQPRHVVEHERREHEHEPVGRRDPQQAPQRVAPDGRPARTANQRSRATCGRGGSPRGRRTASRPRAAEGRRASAARCRRHSTTRGRSGSSTRRSRGGRPVRECAVPGRPARERRRRLVAASPRRSDERYVDVEGARDPAADLAAEPVHAVEPQPTHTGLESRVRGKQDQTDRACTCGRARASPRRRAAVQPRSA